MNLIHTGYDELNDHLNNKLLVKYDDFARYISTQHFSRICSYVFFLFVTTVVFFYNVNNNTGIMLTFSFEFCVLNEN